MSAEAKPDEPQYPLEESNGSELKALGDDGSQHQGKCDSQDDAEWLRIGGVSANGCHPLRRTPLGQTMAAAIPRSETISAAGAKQLRSDWSRFCPPPPKDPTMEARSLSQKLEPR